MSEKGFILVPALLFLFLVSILVVDTYEALSMQHQLQQTAQMQQQLFFLAEHGLRIGEAHLQSFSENHLSVKVEKLPTSDKTDQEQPVDYRVSSIANKQNLRVCLQSIIAVGKTAKRMAWFEANGDEEC